MSKFTHIYVNAPTEEIRHWLLRVLNDQQKDYIVKERYWAAASDTARWKSAQAWCYNHGGKHLWFDAIQCSAHPDVVLYPIFILPYGNPELPKEEPTMDKPELVQIKIAQPAGVPMTKDKIVSDLVDALIPYVKGHTSPHAQYKSGQAGATHIPVDVGMKDAAVKAIKAAGEAVTEEPKTDGSDKDKLIKQLAAALKPFASLVRDPENLVPLDNGWNMSVKPRDVMNAQEALAVYENGDKLIHLDRLIKEYADSPDSPYYNSPKDTALIAEALKSLRDDLSERE